MKNNELNWILRVEGMEPEQIMDYAPRGATSTGSLKLRWKHQPILKGHGTDRNVRTLSMLLMMI
jgi:hypothetical protein